MFFGVVDTYSDMVDNADASIIIFVGFVIPNTN